MEASHGRVVGPVVVFALGAATQIAVSAWTGQGAGAVVLAVPVQVVPVLVGLLIGWRAPDVPVGAALVWVGAAPAMVFAVELWGESSLTDRPLPGNELLYRVELGAWVWNLAGFAALCLVFPDGLLPGRRWRAVAWSAVATGVLVNVAVSWVRGMDPDGPGPGMAARLLAWSTFAALLAALAACVLSLIVRYRRGDPVVRDQVRWLMLGAGSVPALLGCGWIAEAYGVSTGLAYSGFMLAMLIAVPASVAVAILRHDLFDIDRLLGASLAWLLTTLASATIFAATVYGIGELVAGPGRAVTAAFVTALLLLPLHRRIYDMVGRVVDRDRHIIETRLRDFVAAVRDGRAAPNRSGTSCARSLTTPRSACSSGCPTRAATST